MRGGMNYVFYYELYVPSPSAMLWFLSPIKEASGYKLGWLIGKLYFSGGTMITEFEGDLSIASGPIEPIMVVVVYLLRCSLYLR
jgi:hypothetical protein